MAFEDPAGSLNTVDSSIPAGQNWRRTERCAIARRHSPCVVLSTHGPFVAESRIDFVRLSEAYGQGHMPGSVNSTRWRRSQDLTRRRIMFAVEDIDDVVARLRAHGANWLASWCGTRTAIGSVMSVAQGASSSRSPRRSADDSGTVESGEVLGTADRAPQLSWARGGGMGVSIRRLLEPAAASKLRDSPGETLANLSITGPLRSFSDQPVAEIVQCGEPISLGLFRSHG
jgi:hypothetical protein